MSQREEDKKNTEEWKKKQEERKRKKQEDIKLAQQKREEKAEGKTEGKAEGNNEGKTEGNNEVKTEGKNEKKEKKEKKGQEKKEEEKKKMEKQMESPEATLKIYPPLRTIKTLLPVSVDRRSQQNGLIFKYLEPLINSSDSILYLGENEWSPQCEYIHIPDYNIAPKAQIVCRYSDVSVLLESHIKKVFIEGRVLFREGSLLVKRGYLNILLMAQAYSIPVVICCESWSFNGWSAMSEQNIENKYGNILEDNDWVDSKLVANIVTEMGIIDKCQVVPLMSEVYKHQNLAALIW